MADLIGIGRSVEKFLGLVESSIGTLYRPRAIRNEGRAQADAEAYRIVAVAEAQKRANLVLSDTDRELAERAVARLRHQEMHKQSNIESVVDATIKLVEGSDIEEDADHDWLHYFFESCAIVSDQSVQDLWSKVLARKVTSQTSLSRKMIDCLRWMDARLAKQFIDLAPRIFLFGGFFVQDVELENQVFKSVGFSFDAEAMEEIGLLKEDVGKTFSFNFGSLKIECQELSDRSLEFRRFYDLTHTGRQLANIVCPTIAEFNARRKSAVGAERYDWTSDEYSNFRNEFDSLLIPSGERIRLAVGHLVHFLIEIPARVRIEKCYAEDASLARKALLSILKLSYNEMHVEVGAETRIKKLHSSERQFLELLVSHLEANRQLICHLW